MKTLKYLFFFSLFLLFYSFSYSQTGDLKQQVNDSLKTNQNRQITASNLRNVFFSFVDTVRKNASNQVNYYDTSLMLYSYRINLIDYYNRINLLQLDTVTIQTRLNNISL